MHGVNGHITWAMTLRRARRVLSNVRNIGVFVVSTTMGTTAVGCAALQQLTQHAINCSTLCSTVVIPVHRFEQTITVDVIASLMMSLISSY